MKRTNTVPQLTRFGKLLGLSVFTIPLGLLLTSSALKQNITIDPTLPPAWRFILELTVGLAFTFAPIFILAFKWLITSTTQFDEDVARGWALLFNKSITEERTETLKTADPTSIEFEDIFKELMNEALLDPTKRAILVLDNLDRVDPSDALSIWSTLQTFLRHTYYETPVWFNKLWVLILYDPRGIRLLWDRDQRPTEINSSFLDKSFQIRFRISHPTLSYWHSYLVQRLKEALPHHTETEFHAVYQVLSLSTFGAVKWKTIRGLKLFVNQIGSIHRQWNDAFPLSHMAYYVLISDFKEADSQWLLSSDFPEEKLKGVLAADSDIGLSKLKDSLAALYFNVEVTLARQLLLSNPITTALFSETEEINNLREIATGHEGFWQVLERVLSDDPFQDRGELIATAAHALQRSGLLDIATEVDTDKVKQEFCKAALRPSVDWSKLETSTSIDGLCLLIRWRLDPQFTKTILRAILFRVNVDLNERTFHKRSWIATLNKLSEELKSINHHSYFVESVIKPLADEIRTTDTLSHWKFIHILHVLWDLNVADEYAKKAIVELIAENHLLRHLNSIDGHTLIEDAQKAVTARRMQDRRVYPSIEAAALALYIYLNFSQSLFDLSELEKNISGPDNNYERLHEILTNGDDLYGCVGIFVEYLSHNKKLHILIELIEVVPSSRHFVGSCLRSLNSASHNDLQLPPEKFLKLWRLLKDELDKDRVGRFNNLTAYMVTDGLLNHLCNPVNNLFNLFNPNDIELYIVIEKVSQSHKTEFGDWLKAGLTSITKNEWAYLLNDKNGALTIRSLVNTINQFGLTLTESYQEALIEYALRVADGELCLEIGGDILLAPLDRDRRRQVRKELINIATKHKGNPSDQFFKLFGKEMFDPVILDGQDSLIAQLLIPMLQTYTPTKLSWLFNLLTNVPQIHSKSQATDIEGLKNKVTEVINEFYQMIPTRLTDGLIDLLSIKRNELEPSIYKEVVLFDMAGKSKSYHFQPRMLTEGEEYEGMSNVIERLGRNLTVGLINTPGGLQVMCSGGSNGEIIYYESPHIISLLRLRGLIKIKSLHQSGLYVEHYELTENGQQLYMEATSLEDKKPKIHIEACLRAITPMNGE